VSSTAPGGCTFAAIGAPRVTRHRKPQRRAHARAARAHWTCILPQPFGRRVRVCFFDGHGAHAARHSLRRHSAFARPQKTSRHDARRRAVRRPHSAPGLAWLLARVSRRFAGRASSLVFTAARILQTRFGDARRWTLRRARRLAASRRVRRW